MNPGAAALSFLKPGSPFRSLLSRWRDRRRPSGPDLHPLVQVLLRRRADIHRTFSTCGHDLSELDRHSRTLLEKCEALHELTQGNSDGGNLFQESLHVLDRPIKHIEESLHSFEPMLAHLDRCDHHSAELLKCQLAMGEVLAPLRHMIVFFRIEAAQLEPEHQTTFLTVADEIHRLRELIDKTFDENVARLREARSTVGKVRDRVKRASATHTARVTEKHRQIRQATAALGDQLGNDPRQDGLLRDTTRALRQDLGQLDSALGSGDPLLHDLDQLLQRLRSGPPPGATNAWMQLAQRQLLELLNRLGTVRTELDQHLVRIASHGGTLGESSRRLRQPDHATASIDDTVKLLLAAFEDITAIAADQVKLAADSYDALKPVSDVTENLSSVVIEVSLNIQLIALNAQVRSVQLGDGYGLEVLAARTAEISAELGKLGDRTANEIIELRTVTQGLLAQLDEMRSTGQEDLEALRAQGTTVVDQLHHLREHTLQVMQAVASQLDCVVPHTAAQPTRWDGLTHAETCFKRCSDWLERHTTASPVTDREQSLLAAHLGSSRPPPEPPPAVAAAPEPVAGAVDTAVR